MSPPLQRLLPVTLSSHCASLSHLALSSSRRAYWRLFPACPIPSPTWTILSRRHCTLALITAVERRRRKYPVTSPNSFSPSGLPFRRPWLRSRDWAKLPSKFFTPWEALFLLGGSLPPGGGDPHWPGWPVRRVQEEEKRQYRQERRERELRKEI